MFLRPRDLDTGLGQDRYAEDKDARRPITPFNMETLEHFVFLERPRGVHHEDGEGFDAEADYERSEAHHGLMPSIQDYNTIGRLYDALRTNLTTSARRLGDGALFIGPIDAQVGPDVVKIEGVRTIDSLASALKPSTPSLIKAKDQAVIARTRIISASCACSRSIKPSQRLTRGSLRLIGHGGGW